MPDFEEYHDDKEEIYEGRGWLPTWWTIMLWAGFAFALVYGVYMHGIAGWSQAEQYEEEVAAHNEEFPPVVVSLNEDGSNPYRGDPRAIERGEKSYQATCAACHKVDGTGLIGPSLVDATWLHGATDAQVFDVIMHGRLTPEQWKLDPPKGPMPAHENSLGPQKILEVMAWLAEKNASLKPN